MFCGNCGHEITKEGNFCPSCGAELRTEDSRPKKKEKRSGRSPAVLAVCLVLLTVVIGVAGFFAYTGIRNWQYARCVEEGAALVAEQSWSEAAEAYEKASQIKPKEELPYLRLAEIFEAQGKLKQSLKILEEGYEITESEQIRDELAYYEKDKSADAALADGDYETAIDCLETMIESKPDIADNYLALAEAYVQVWDLYRADEALRKGYAATEDAALRHVSIWGPLSPEQIALAVADGDWNDTRCEYVFADSGIYSYLYYAGRIFLGTQYICEDGKVKYVSVFDTESSSLIGFLPHQIPNYPACEAYYNYDYGYNAEGRVTEILCDGEKILSLTYDKGNCVKVTAHTDYYPFDKGDKITFVYDKQNRITEIGYCQADGNPVRSVLYTYKPDGSCIAQRLGKSVEMEYDQRGMLIGVYAHHNTFTTERKNGQIVKVKWYEDYYYEYADGKLVGYAQQYADGGRLEARYIYGDINGQEFVTEIKVEETYSEEVTQRLSYDKRGNIIGYDYGDGYYVEFLYFNAGLPLEEIRYDNGEIRVRYKMEYDEVGRLINKTMLD